jgi:hypothetical protein
MGEEGTGGIAHQPLFLNGKPFVFLLKSCQLKRTRDGDGSRIALHEHLGVTLITD